MYQGCQTCGSPLQYGPLYSLYLGGQGDLVSRLVRGIVRVTMWVIGVINYLLSPHNPPSTAGGTIILSTHHVNKGEGILLSGR